MVKIIHVSDTHLGFRLRSDVKKDWYDFGKTGWYENDFYIRWNEFIKYCIENREKIDFVVHAGDLFHSPFKDHPYPPPETARKVVVEGLLSFFEETDNQIPFILIDGNHGVYKGYRYSLMDNITPLFPNLHFFSVWDLRHAINDNSPLVCEFPDKNTCFFLFPYLEFSYISGMKIAYDRWIENQRPKRNMINIAIIHGSTIDKSFNERIATFNYDYVALGHEHNQRKLSDRIYYSGDFVPLHFNEVNFTHGFLEVDFETGQKLVVTKHNFESPRVFKEIQLNINPSTTTSSIIQDLEKEIDPYKTTSWDGESAARLKIDFLGNIPLDVFWGLMSELDYFKSNTLNESKYNILQMKLNWKLLSKELIEGMSPEIIKEYILKDPKKEFIEYIETKVRKSEGYDMDLLAEIAIETIEHSIKKFGEGEE